MHRHRLRNIDSSSACSNGAEAIAQSRCDTALAQPLGQADSSSSSESDSESDEGESDEGDSDEGESDEGISDEGESDEGESR